MSMQAVDEYELADCPEDRFDRLLFHFALVVEERDVRIEIRLHQMPQAFSCHLRAKCLPKQSQTAQSISAKQDERMIARPAAKARDAVERNRERWHAYLLCGLTRHPKIMFEGATSTIERKQRDVQVISLDEIAIELTSAPDHLRQAIDV